MCLIHRCAESTRSIRRASTTPHQARRAPTEASETASEAASPKQARSRRSIPKAGHPTTGMQTAAAQRPRQQRRCCPVLLLWTLALLLLLHAPTIARAEQPPSSPSPTSTTAPGGFSSKGELPQMDFARLGAQKAAAPALCARVGDEAFFLCGARGWGRHELVERGGVGGGSGLHVLAPGVGCLCQGHDGDVLAQVSVLRREAERYQSVFGHPISARTLALRAAEALQGKGQQAWSRPPACITVIAGIGSSTSAELYQVDPMGLVFPIRGLAFGGAGLKGVGGEEDVTGEALNAWLAEGEAEATGSAEEEEGDGAEWRRLWAGMVACYPSLEGREGEVECAVVSGRRGFRCLGALDRVLGGRLPRPKAKQEGEGEEEAAAEGR